MQEFAFSVAFNVPLSTSSETVQALPYMQLLGDRVVEVWAYVSS